MPKCPCGKQAIFNVSGEKVGVCCAECKTSDMFDVVHKKCPCGKQPKFNVLGQKPICCAKCKTEEMINVVCDRCLCGNYAIYNVQRKNPICCKECKTGDMINVVSKRCPCGKIPSFNLPGEKKPISCTNCKTDDMINVVSKRCSCGSLSIIYNIPEEIYGVCCSKCKTDEMVDVVNKKCSCGKIPSFNIPGENIGICCSKCKTDEMIDVRHDTCPGYDEPCIMRIRLSRGHVYCMSCDPDDSRRKRYKLYEEAFFDYVKDRINIHKREFRVTFDPNETSKKFARLDGIVFGDGIIVCLEVDENGHQDYDCDEHRMHLVTAELLQKYPDYVVSWVRVNPTTTEKSQTSKKSKKIREKRFEDVVKCVNDILETKEIIVKYIGFE